MVLWLIRAIMRCPIKMFFLPVVFLLILCVFPVALAEELSVVDIHGNVRLLVDVSAVSDVTIRVVITDPTRDAKDGVAVHLMSSDTRQEIETRDSDVSGIVEFPDIPPGKYIIELDKEPDLIFAVQAFAPEVTVPGPATTAVIARGIVPAVALLGAGSLATAVVLSSSNDSSSKPNPSPTPEPSPGPTVEPSPQPTAMPPTPNPTSEPPLSPS